MHDGVKGKKAQDARVTVQTRWASFVGLESAQVADFDPGWPPTWSSRVRNSCRTVNWHLVVHGRM